MNDILSLTHDEEYELGEAVCDAVLNRMHFSITGKDENGKYVYGRSPIEAFTSGFLLTKNLEYDSNISSQGLDFRIESSFQDGIKTQPHFSIYIRVIPTPEEIAEPRYGLMPNFKLNEKGISKLKYAVKEANQDIVEKKLQSADAQIYRQKACNALLKSIGVKLKDDSFRLVSDSDVVSEDETDDVNDAFYAEKDNKKISLSGCIIPDIYSPQYPIPEKYLRVPIEVPYLSLSMEQLNNNKLLKRAIEAYDILVNEKIKSTITKWLVSEEGVRTAWRKKSAIAKHFYSEEAWRDFCLEVTKEPNSVNNHLPDTKVSIQIDVIDDTNTLGHLNVRALLEVISPDEKKTDINYRNAIYQTSLDIEIPTGGLKWFDLERIKRSYHLDGFLQHPALGVNGGFDHTSNPESDILYTTWCPRFVLPKLTPVKFTDVPVLYQTLKSRNPVGNLFFLSNRMSEWIEETKRKSGYKSQEDQCAFQQDIDAWNLEKIRIEKGILLLSESESAYNQDSNSSKAIPYRAWLLLNESFYNLKIQESNRAGWRLFQLSFILSHIPTLASRIPDFSHYFDEEFDEKSASLLYMSTGGGKSEAFFGLVVYSLFLDRLRGKSRGITAMLHYPLRLLTLQQARRLMSIIAKAEIIRHDEKIPGAPFEIGFWVGNSNTPNHTYSDKNINRNINKDVQHIPLGTEDSFGEREEEYLENKKDYQISNDSWNKIPECPFCYKGNTFIRMYPKKGFRLGIVCPEKDCDWNIRHDKDENREPLPFLITDSDIYHHAPSIILGTIDKLALIGNHPSTINKVAGMFGLSKFLQGSRETGILHSTYDLKMIKVHLEDDDFQKISPIYPEGIDLFFDPIPSLIIQDELHLLEESLGTFGGIFETTLLKWLSEISKFDLHVPQYTSEGQIKHRMPHVIGATATAVNAKKQIRELYQKNSIQFPHTGPELYSSFYTQIDTFFQDGEAFQARNTSFQKQRDIEKNSKWSRVYQSVLTNHKNHTSATLEIIIAYSIGVSRWILDLSSQDPLRKYNALVEIQNSLSQSSMYQRHHTIIGKALDEHLYEIVYQKVDLHRILLTYVAQKKGGDQIISALERQILSAHQKEGKDYNIDEFMIELISGSVDIRGIQDIIRKAEEDIISQNKPLSEALRVIVATSAISHGVDVSSLNAMLFVGMPTDIAEYIQASSRVGRSHVGFSLMVASPKNRRDKFIVENHEHFHRFLERMIAPPAIARWSEQAIKRVIPSLMQTYFAGIYYPNKFLISSDSLLPLKSKDIKYRLKGEERFQTLGNLILFIEESIGLHNAENEYLKDYYKKMLANEINNIISKIEKLDDDDSKNLMDFFRENFSSPMSSLRDVQDMGVICGRWKNNKGNVIKPEDISNALMIARTRKIGKRKHNSVSGETDLEYDTIGGVE